jgi:hypothetical protein
MIPIDFWASLEPWEKAIAQAERSWRRRDTLVTVRGRVRRNPQVSRIMP